MQLELLYCPFGTESNYENPFSAESSMTALEKALKTPGTAKEKPDLEAASQKKKEVIVRGVISIVVISAENLPKVDLMGKADPFVVLTLKKSGAKAKTRVRFRNLNHRSSFVLLDLFYIGPRSQVRDIYLPFSCLLRLQMTP